MLRLDRKARLLGDEFGRRFDAAARRWIAGMVAGDPIDEVAAARWLQRESGAPCRVPVGVIGPREATPAQIALAEEIGRRLGALGATVICGGKNGVMEAVCRGVAGAGGLSIGLLPDEHWDGANAFVSVAIATGIGVARNAIIARAALCLIAIGGGYGTLSEIAFGLQFGRPVFTLAGAPAVEGATALPDADALERRVARVVLGLD